MIRVLLEELDLRHYLRPGDGVVTSQGTAEPLTLTEALVAQGEAIGPLSIFLGSASFADTFTPERHGGHRLLTYGAAGGHRALVKAGLMAVIPAHVSLLPSFIGTAIPCDVAMIQVAGPDADGLYSYSLSSDYTVEAVSRARVVIAECNRRGPVTRCETRLDPGEIDVLVESDRPLPQMPRAAPGALDMAIARHVAGYIEDRATLQIGYGAIPEAIIATLGDRRDLGLHTGVIGDSVVDLIEGGTITNAHKEVNPGISVTGALWGTDRLYRFVDRNPDILLSRIIHTHSAETLGRLSRLVAINGAIEVDLTGQVNAEQVGNAYLGAVGGQVDFIRAGARSASGAGIIALASTAQDGKISKIVPRLNGPVTTARSDVDVIATEHGAVRLRGLPLAERARLMIGLAAEPFREALAGEARAMFGPGWR